MHAEVFVNGEPVHGIGHVGFNFPNDDDSPVRQIPTGVQYELPITFVPPYVKSRPYNPDKPKRRAKNKAARKARRNNR